MNYIRACKGALVNYCHFAKHKKEKPQKHSLLCQLPEEVLANIFSFVEGPSQGNLKLTCKKFKRISQEPSIKSSIMSRIGNNLPEKITTAIAALSLSELQNCLYINCLGLILVKNNPLLLEQLNEEEKNDLKNEPLFQDLFPLG